MTNQLPKILLATFEFPPENGGMQQYYANLAKQFGDEGIVVLTKNCQGAEAFDQPQRFKIIRQDLLYDFFWPRWLKIVFIIKSLVKKEKIDLLWVGDILPLGTVAWLLNLFWKIPYFVSLHGLDLSLATRSNLKKKITLKIVKRAKFLTANSLSTKNQLLDLGVRTEKIWVIYPAFEPSFSVDQLKVIELKNQLALTDKKVILTISRLVARKNQAAVIKALPQVLTKFPQTVYLIIGNGPELKSLNQLAAELKVAEHVIFVNDVIDEQLPNYYQLADLFVMVPKVSLSDPEGFGIVYLEAAYYGLPVIAGRNGGGLEAVLDQQTGLLSGDQPEEMAAKIIQLLTNPELASKLGSAAKERVLKQFSYQQQSELFKKVISQYA